MLSEPYTKDTEIKSLAGGKKKEGLHVKRQLTMYMS